jgi:hypothetical protein
MKREIEPLLTYQALSEKLGLSVRVLRKLKGSGVLPFVELNNKLVLFRGSAVAEQLARMERYKEIG